SLVQIGCVRLAQPYLIQPVSLPAQATQKISVLTMTDGGSFYPVSVGVTATPPQPQAPPITAPDGCFPKPETLPTPPA
ncbi:MAG TPA: hypothetical protein VMH02_13355, partial [Verrucomicrobiae bacterium]|nr:hypothetical protein [Verrucomicrobiae bacterium]